MVQGRCPSDIHAQIDRDSTDTLTLTRRCDVPGSGPHVPPGTGRLQLMGRSWAGPEGIAGRAVRWLDQVNARHPWSHNDYFHSWITANLPDGRRTALDVGCGSGGLVATLAPRFEHVLGTDVDQAMRDAAAQRCGHLGNVRIGSEPLAELDGPFDLITMVAVLHHLEVRDALIEVRRLLSPGGRFLCVGLARPSTPADIAWDLWSVVTNPVIGFVHHPWPSTDGSRQPPFPVRDPSVTYADLRQILDAVLPGAVMRRRVGFRHTIEWTKPSADRPAE